MSAPAVPPTPPKPPTPPAIVAPALAILVPPGLPSVRTPGPQPSRDQTPAVTDVPVTDQISLPVAPPPVPPVETEPPVVQPEASDVQPDFVNTNASRPLPNPLGVAGGLLALALAGGGAGVISFQNAGAAQARVASARAEFFGPSLG